MLQQTYKYIFFISIYQIIYSSASRRNLAGNRGASKNQCVCVCFRHVILFWQRSTCFLCTAPSHHCPVSRIRLQRSTYQQVLLRCYRTGGCDDTNLNNTPGPDAQETFQAIKPRAPLAVHQAGQRFGTIVSVVSGNAGFTMLLAHCSHMVSDKGYPGQHLQQQCLYLCSSGSIWLG